MNVLLFISLKKPLRKMFLLLTAFVFRCSDYYFFITSAVSVKSVYFVFSPDLTTSSANSVITKPNEANLGMLASWRFLRSRVIISP